MKMIEYTKIIVITYVNNSNNNSGLFDYFTLKIVKVEQLHISSFS